LLASPVSTFKRLGELIISASFWEIVANSCLRILLGFLFGLAAGAIVAFLTAFNRAAYAFFSPAMNVVKATPVASFVVLAIVWVGSGNLSVLCTFLMVTPIVWTNVHAGLTTADPALLEMAAAFRLPRKKVNSAIRIPALLPHLLSALRVSLGFAWKAGVAGEVIAIPRGSIGTQLYTAKVTLDTVELLAWTAVVIILSVALERLMIFVTNLLAKRMEANAK